MNLLSRKNVLTGLIVILFTASCASTRTLHVWRDEGHDKKLGKTLVIAVAELDFMRNHFENVLALRLGDHGLDAIPSNKVMAELGAKPDRALVAAKARELGVESVIVARAISKAEYSRLTPGGSYFVPSGFYTDWNSFYADSLTMVSVPGSAYDAEFFTMVTNIYDVRSEKLIWSYLAKVKVETSRQGAINPFIETIMKQLENSSLL